MISIDFSQVTPQPLKQDTKIFGYQNNLVDKVLTSSTQDQLLTNMEQVFKNSNHTHSNILPCTGYTTSTEGNTTKLHIFYPVMKNSLSDLIQRHIQNKTSFSKEELLSYFDGLLSAAEYLESQGLQHKNIKPQNILFDEFNVIKLTEIGSGSLEKHKASSSLFIAPEVLVDSSLSTDQWHKADVWSLGMVILEMWDFRSTFSSVSVKAGSGSFSYTDNTFSEIATRIETLKRIPNSGTELAEIISMMLNPDYTSRPTFRHAKWLFFEKVLTKSKDAVEAPSDESVQEANSMLESEENIEALENEFLNKNEECKKEEPQDVYFSQLKESQQIFYDTFYAKFLDRFKLVPKNGNTLFICMKTAQEKLTYKQPNLQTLIPTITKVSVKSAAVTDPNLAILAAGLLLFSSAPCLLLDFRDAKISDTGLIYLFDFAMNYFKNLKFFYLWTTSSQVTDKSISFLARGPLSKLPEMRHFFISCQKTQVTDHMFEELREPLIKMKDLIILQFWVHNTKVTDASIRMLCSQVLYHKTELQTFALAVSNNPTTSASLQELTFVVLPRLTKLKVLYLHIGSMNVTEENLLNLFKYGIANLQELEKVNFGFSCLKALNDITFEQLVEVGLNNKKNLKEIMIYAGSSKIANKAILDICYKLLPRLMNLEKFEITTKGTKIESKVIDQIKHLPYYDKCKISF